MAMSGSNSTMARKPHVIVVPCPAQGHVAPLMKLAHKLAENGVKVTFFNTEFVHEKIVAAAGEGVVDQWQISLASVPDGLLSEQDRRDRVKLTESVLRTAPGRLQELVEEINGYGGSGPEEMVTCIVADSSAGWAVEVANRMGIRSAAVALAGVRNLALVLLVPELIRSGIIDSDGIPMKDDEPVYLSNGSLACTAKELPWCCPGNPSAQRYIFTRYTLRTVEAIKLADWILANSFSEIEPLACDLIPNILQIGPVLSSKSPGHTTGSFFPEDLKSLAWLDTQPERSVVYAAFGSTTSFNEKQFEELAHGLELAGRPFLWVVGAKLRNGATTADIEFPDGFIERVGTRGQVVQWAAQEKVLAHPSVGCFFSHCGWNSTLEGLSMGVPFLCWPQFADQFCNKRYICETWKVGIELVPTPTRPDQSQIASRDQIKGKIVELLCDDVIRTNSLGLKEIARSVVRDGGSSFNNLSSFIELLKE